MIESASLMLELNSPRKKLCPKLEKNVNINPNIITFLDQYLENHPDFKTHVIAGGQVFTIANFNNILDITGVCFFVFELLD